MLEEQQLVRDPVGGTIRDEAFLERVRLVVVDPAEPLRDDRLALRDRVATSGIEEVDCHVGTIAGRTPRAVFAGLSAAGKRPLQHGGDKGSRSGTVSPAARNGTCRRTISAATAVPRRAPTMPRSSIAWAATVSSIATTRVPSATISASRRAASGARLVRSSMPSAWAVDTSSFETGAASNRASAAIDCAAIPRYDKPGIGGVAGCGETGRQARPGRLEQLDAPFRGRREQRRPGRSARSRAPPPAAGSRSWPPGPRVARRASTIGLPCDALSSMASMCVGVGECIATGTQHLRQVPEAQRILEGPATFLARWIALPSSMRPRFDARLVRRPGYGLASPIAGSMDARVGEQRLEAQCSGDLHRGEEGRSSHRGPGLPPPSKTSCSRPARGPRPASSATPSKRPAARSAICARSDWPDRAEDPDPRQGAGVERLHQALGQQRANARVPRREPIGEPQDRRPDRSRGASSPCATRCWRIIRFE